MIIVLTFIPGLLAKLMQDKQTMKMKKMDARIQMVTESMIVLFNMTIKVDCLFSSHECVAYGEIIWMGRFDEPKNSGYSRGRGHIHWQDSLA